MSNSTFKSWKPVVQFITEPGKWHSNGLRFETMQEAKESAANLGRRCFGVVCQSAMPDEEPPTHKLTDSKLERLET